MGMVFLAGCGGPKFCEVSGSVSADGSPVESGMIVLTPADPESPLRTVAAEIVQGAYKIPPSKKLEPGTYTVAITGDRKTGRKIETDPGSGQYADEIEQFVPETYNAKSKLTAKILGDRADLDFALTIAKKPKE